MAYKFQFLAKNSVFWVLVVSSQPLNPILQVPDSMEHVLQGYGCMCCMVLKPENGFFIFCPKIAYVNIGPKTMFFWPWEVSSRPPNPILQVLDSEKHQLRGMEAKKYVFWGHPTQKNGHFLAKNGLNLPILGKKAVSLDTAAQFKTPLPFFWGA